MTLRVVSLWSSSGSIINQAVQRKCILPSRMLKLYPEIGEKVSVLALFLVRKRILVAASTVDVQDASGRARIGLIPLDCLSLSGKKPTDHPKSFVFPLHEAALPFSGRVRTEPDQPSFAVEGVLNVLALEFWRKDVSTLHLHPLIQIFQAERRDEKIEITNGQGITTVTYFVFSFRTKRPTGTDVTQCLSFLLKQEIRLKILIPDSTVFQI